MEKKIETETDKFGYICFVSISRHQRRFLHNVARYQWLQIWCNPSYSLTVTQLTASKNWMVDNVDNIQVEIISAANFNISWIHLSLSK